MSSSHQCVENAGISIFKDQKQENPKNNNELETFINNFVPDDSLKKQGFIIVKNIIKAHFPNTTAKGISAYLGVSDSWIEKIFALDMTKTISPEMAFRISFWGKFGESDYLKIRESNCPINLTNGVEQFRLSLIRWTESLPKNFELNPSEELNDAIREKEKIIRANNPLSFHGYK